MEIGNAELQHRFVFKPLKSSEDGIRHESVEAACLDVAEIILEETGPPSREQSLAITKLEEVMFWANAAIARGPAPE